MVRRLHRHGGSLRKPGVTRLLPGKTSVSGFTLPISRLWASSQSLSTWCQSPEPAGSPPLWWPRDSSPLDHILLEASVLYSFRCPRAWQRAKDAEATSSHLFISVCLWVQEAELTQGLAHARNTHSLSLSELHPQALPLFIVSFWDRDLINCPGCLGTCLLSQPP